MPTRFLTDKTQIAILEEIIAQNKSAKIETDLSQINEHLLELHHENQQLKDDIDKRESTLKNLIYRYDQSERKVREFIKTTLRLVICLVILRIFFKSSRDFSRNFLKVIFTFFASFSYTYFYILKL